MRGFLVLLGRCAGLGAVLLCVYAGAMRLAGNFYAGSFQLGTLLLASIAGLLVGCFLLLFALTLRSDSGPLGRSRD